MGWYTSVRATNPNRTSAVAQLASSFLLMNPGLFAGEELFRHQHILGEGALRGDGIFAASVPALLTVPRGIQGQSCWSTLRPCGLMTSAQVMAVKEKIQSGQATALKIYDVMGSTAGAGSGDFHHYRNSRRREMFRLMSMDRDDKREQVREGCEQTYDRISCGGHSEETRVEKACRSERCRRADGGCAFIPLIRWGLRM